MDSMSRRVSALRIGGWIVLFGLLVSTYAVIARLIEYFAITNLNQFPEAIRDFMLSPSVALLVLFALWLERALQIWKLRKHDSAAKARYWSNHPVVHRIRRWFSAMLAWGSTGLALILIFDFSETLVLIVCGLVFGSAMWLVEGSSTLDAKNDSST